MSDELSPEVFDAVCRQADQAARAQERLAQANTEAKNELLLAIADALDEHAADIEAANALDMLESKENGMDAGKLDRLLFVVPRVAAAAQGVRHVATLPDPVGEIVRGYNLPNGLRLTQTRVPMGVIGMIYEARPNVTVDVASLCLKSGNAALLRGGHAAERTNAATLGVIAPVLEAHGFESALVQSVDQYGRAGATAMMEARGHIDVLVPRGGAGLIQAVVRNSKVPVIETGAGNVHIYIDKSGDLAKAIPIIINAKTQRVGVCNAAEKLLVHKDVAAEFLPQVDRNHSVPLVFGGVRVDLEALCGQFTDGSFHSVGADGDMALLTQIVALHDLNGGCREIGGIAQLGLEAEGLTEAAAERKGAFRVRAIDADVGYLKAQNSLAGFPAQLGDFLKVPGGNVRLGANPAAAYGVDKGSGYIFRQILRVYAACGNKLYAAEGAGESFHGAEAAVDIGGEEFENLQPQLHGLHNFCRRDAAGGDGNVMLYTPGYDLPVEAGGDNKGCAAVHCLFALFQGDDRTGTYQHFWAVFTNRPDGIRCCGSTEGNLHYIDAAAQHGFCGGDGVLCVLNYYHRYNTGGG